MAPSSRVSPVYENPGAKKLKMKRKEYDLMRILEPANIAFYKRTIDPYLESDFELFGRLNEELQALLHHVGS